MLPKYNSMIEIIVVKLDGLNQKNAFPYTWLENKVFEYFKVLELKTNACEHIRLPVTSFYLFQHGPDNGKTFSGLGGEVFSLKTTMT